MQAQTTTASRGHLVIDGVSKIYESAHGDVLAVDRCSLDIPAGEICMVVGPSGCGKTTLLNAVAGFHSITWGSITLDGRDLCNERTPQARPGSDRVVVFQNGALFPWKTVLENLIFGPVMQGKMTKPQAIERAHELLRQAGLTGSENSYPGQISSGMRRRAEIARALMNDPDVLLLDEPYRALDALTRSMMHEALLAMHAINPVTIMFITHDLEEAIFLGHRVVVMSSRPCRPKQMFDVDIPFPREKSVVTTERYRQLVALSLAAVHEEAAVSFAAGENEGD